MSWTTYQAKVEAEARDRADIARWKALPEAEREAFRAAFAREVPRWEGGKAKLWEVMARDTWILRTRSADHA